jgi:hypothetical protein
MFRQVYMRHVRESPSFSSTYARDEQCSRLSVFLRELCATGATSHGSLTSNTVTTSALCNSAARFAQSHCPTFQNLLLHLSPLLTADSDEPSFTRVLHIQLSLLPPYFIPQDKFKDKLEAVMYFLIWTIPEQESKRRYSSTQFIVLGLRHRNDRIMTCFDDSSMSSL